MSKTYFTLEFIEMDEKVVLYRHLNSMKGNTFLYQTILKKKQEFKITSTATRRVERVNLKRP